MIVHYSLASQKGSASETNTDQVLVCQGDQPLSSGEDESKGTVKSAGIVASICDSLVPGSDGLESCKDAQQLIVELLRESSDLDRLDIDDAKRLLGEGIKRVHELMLQQTEVRDDELEMQASLAIAWFSKDCIIFSHVGNARVYRFTDGVAELLTDDHTEAWELVTAGKITPDKVGTYPGRKNMTQLLGGKKKLQPKPELKSLKLEKGDVFVLCSDGLIEGFSDRDLQEQLTACINENGQLDLGSAQKIIEKSQANSGDDDASVVVCQAFPNQSVWTSIIERLEEAD